MNPYQRTEVEKPLKNDNNAHAYYCSFVKSPVFIYDLHNKMYGVHPLST